jgi:hypothetical protein
MGNGFFPPHQECKGDPLGPLLFSLAIHPLIQELAAEHSSVMLTWYLDDGTVLRDYAVVGRLFISSTRALDPGACSYSLTSPRFGGLLVVRLGFVFRAGFILDHGVGTHVLRLLSSGRGLLPHLFWAAVGHQWWPCYERLPELDDPVLEFPLLRSCLSACRVVFSMRCSPPAALFRGRGVIWPEIVRGARPTHSWVSSSTPASSILHCFYADGIRRAWHPGYSRMFSPLPSSLPLTLPLHYSALLSLGTLHASSCVGSMPSVLSTRFSLHPPIAPHIACRLWHHPFGGDDLEDTIGAGLGGGGLVPSYACSSWLLLQLGASGVWASFAPPSLPWSSLVPLASAVVRSLKISPVL